MNAPEKSFSDPGPQPELLWLPLSQLTVDQRYQRSADSRSSIKLIGRMARDFTWSKFQPPTVATIGPDSYAIVDGQHRVAAARLHPGIDDVPCYLIAAPELAEQASSFVGINRDRVAVHPLTQHHALVEAGDADALRVRAVCILAGVVIPRSPRGGSIYPENETPAVGTLSKGIARYGREAVVRALKILVAAGQPAREGIMVSNALAGMFLITSEFGPDRMDDDRMAQQIIHSSGMSALQETARQHRGVFGGAMADIMRLTFIKLYNRKLRGASQLPEQA